MAKTPDQHLADAEDYLEHCAWDAASAHALVGIGRSLALLADAIDEAAQTDRLIVEAQLEQARS